MTTYNIDGIFWDSVMFLALPGKSREELCVLSKESREEEGERKTTQAFDNHGSVTPILSDIDTTGQDATRVAICRMLRYLPMLRCTPTALVSRTLVH